LATLKSILDVIDQTNEAGGAALVHCFAGMDRTGNVVGCHWWRQGRVTAWNVVAQIAGLRKGMPGGHEPSPHTPDQVRLVGNWADGA
jgi:protein-tyrosine phosphatase